MAQKKQNKIGESEQTCKQTKRKKQQSTTSVDDLLRVQVLHPLDNLERRVADLREREGPVRLEATLDEGVQSARVVLEIQANLARVRQVVAQILDDVRVVDGTHHFDLRLDGRDDLRNGLRL
jgi:hypothetical protein